MKENLLLNKEMIYTYNKGLRGYAVSNLPRHLSKTVKRLQSTLLPLMLVFFYRTLSDYDAKRVITVWPRFSSSVLCFLSYYFLFFNILLR